MTLSYGTPFTISFFDLSNTNIKAVTNFVSIRGDQVPLSGATATMEAFDVIGNSIGMVTANDSTVGLTLSLRLAGIHSVRLTQNLASSLYDGTIGFDDLTFTPVPLPGTLFLLTTCMSFFGISLKWRRGLR